jgi:hypothetical protein
MAVAAIAIALTENRLFISCSPNTCRGRPCPAMLSGRKCAHIRGSAETDNTKVLNFRPYVQDWDRSGPARPPLGLPLANLMAGKGRKQQLTSQTSAKSPISSCAYGADKALRTENWSFGSCGVFLFVIDLTADFVGLRFSAPQYLPLSSCDGPADVWILERTTAGNCAPSRSAAACRAARCAVMLISPSGPIQGSSRSCWGPDG